MSIDTVRHHGTVGSRESTGPRASTRRGGRSTIRGGRVSIGSSDAIRGRGGGLGLGLGIGVAAETGTLKQVLLLARGVLCANLLAVDTLDGKTLRKQTARFVMSVTLVLGGGLKYYGKYRSHAPYRLPWRGTRRTPRELPGRRSDPCSRRRG